MPSTNGFPLGAAEGTQMLLLDVSSGSASSESGIITAVRPGTYRCSVSWGCSDPDVDTTQGSYVLELLADNTVMASKEIIDPRASIAPGTWSVTSLVVIVQATSNHVLKALKVRLRATGSDSAFADKVIVSYGTSNRFRLTGGELGGTVVSLSPAWVVVPSLYDESPKIFEWKATPSAVSGEVTAWYRPHCDVHFQMNAVVFDTRFPYAQITSKLVYNIPGESGTLTLLPGLSIVTLIGAGGSGSENEDTGTGGGGGQLVVLAFYLQVPTDAKYYVGEVVPAGGYRYNATGTTTLRVNDVSHVAWAGQIGLPTSAGKGGGFDRTITVGRGGDGGTEGGGGGCGGQWGNGGNGDKDSLGGTMDAGDGGGNLAVHGEPPYGVFPFNGNVVGPFGGGGVGPFFRPLGAGQGQAVFAGGQEFPFPPYTAGEYGGGGRRGYNGNDGAIFIEHGPLL